MFNFRTLAVYLLALVFSVDALAAGLTARLDRTRLAEGETVLLTLTASGDTQGTPDLSVLDQEFDILNQSQSTSMRIVNGRSTSSREWQLTLAPKHTGQLKVPAIHLGGISSEALNLEILPAAQAAKLGTVQPLLLEIDAEPKHPLVQQKVLYTMRVLSQLAMRHASLSEPSAKDAIVERLGKDKHYNTHRNGQPYQAIERRYAIFPQHSGSLEIDAPVLSAQVPESTRRGNGQRRRFLGHDPFADIERMFGNDSFGNLNGIFEQTRPVQLRGRNLSLDVQPQPTGAPSPWLPAESLRLSETWSPDPPVFRVGEPVTRTIDITAQGVTTAQLPDLVPQTPAGIKVYPDQPQSKSHSENDTLVAQKILKTALVPSQPGKFTLPEVQLSWWDTHAKRAQVARLPAREVQILPAPAGSSPAPTTAPAPTPAQSPNAAQNPRAESPGPAETGTAAKIEDRPRYTDYWPRIAAGLGFAWLLTTALWLRARGRGRPRSAATEALSDSTPTNPRKILAQVEKACQRNDPKAARQALLEWAAANWPQDPPKRLEDLARRLGSEPTETLRELDRGLYSSAPSSWDGLAAWHRLSPALIKEKRAAASKRQKSPLPPLYPQGVRESLS
jgi:hypothetical protein